MINISSQFPFSSGTFDFGRSVHTYLCTTCTYSRTHIYAREGKLSKFSIWQITNFSERLTSELHSSSWSFYNPFLVKNTDKDVQYGRKFHCLPSFQIHHRENCVFAFDVQKAILCFFHTILHRKSASTILWDSLNFAQGCNAYSDGFCKWQILSRKIVRIGERANLSDNHKCIFFV